MFHHAMRQITFVTITMDTKASLVKKHKHIKYNFESVQLTCCCSLQCVDDPWPVFCKTVNNWTTELENYLKFFLIYEDGITCIGLLNPLSIETSLKLKFTIYIWLIIARHSGIHVWEHVQSIWTNSCILKPLYKRPS